MKNPRFPLIAAALLAWGGTSLAQGRIESLDLLAKIRPGVTKADEVRQLLGAPTRTLRFPARGIEALEYDARDFGQRVVISIAVGSDGTVRDIQRQPQSHP